MIRKRLHVHVSYRRVAVFSALALYAFVAIHKAWVCDDAYITFRTIDNFFHGYGLTWNPDERVQSFTHPLWMLVVSGLHAFTHEFFYTNLFLGAALSYAAVSFLAFRLAPTTHAACLGTVVLTLSRAFSDYSTSGMENPLTHLLLAIFFYVYFGRAMHFQSILWLSLLAALSLVNRLDIAPLVLPPLAFACFRQRSTRTLVAGLVGFSPLLLWEGFSLLYYGSLLPNSALAKLNTGLGTSELAAQGIRYFVNSLRWDPITLVAMVAGIVVTLRNSRAVPVAAGIGCYLLYVMLVGGDFMSGRLFTAPLFVSVILLARSGPGPKWSWGLSGALALLLGAFPRFSPFASRDHGAGYHSVIGEDGITDERVFYEDSSFRRSFGRSPWPQPDVARQAQEMKSPWREDSFAQALKELGVLDESWPPSGQTLPSGKPYRPVLIRGAVGALGFYLGPGIHVLDYHALADPLLSRLPMSRPDPILPLIFPHLAGLEWRVGHYFRAIPGGYVETLGAGENHIRDPDLADYYDKILLITRGGLLDPRRLMAIWNLNVGNYDESIRRYLQVQSKRTRKPIDYATLHFTLGTVYLGAGDCRAAAEHLRRAIALRPDFVQALNNLAWLLATCPDAGGRDGDEAVKLAEMARRKADRTSVDLLDTLAAAYAEAGKYDAAVRTAELALQQAKSEGNASSVSKLEERLRLYRFGRPYHMARAKSVGG